MLRLFEKLIIFTIIGTIILGWVMAVAELVTPQPAFASQIAGSSSSLTAEPPRAARQQMIRARDVINHEQGV